MPVVDASPETPLVLDTDIFSHLRNSQKYVEKNIDAYFSRMKQLPALTAITVFEAAVGIESQIAQNSVTEVQANTYQRRIHHFMQRHEILAFDRKAAEIAAHIYPRVPRGELRKEKGKEKSFWKDIFIVSIVIAHNYGLATGNRSDMELIASHLPEDLDLPLAVWK